MIISDAVGLLAIGYDCQGSRLADVLNAGKSQNKLNLIQLERTVWSNRELTNNSFL